jgi:zinc transport system substrate-binding protein
MTFGAGRSEGFLVVKRATAVVLALAAVALPLAGCGTSPSSSDHRVSVVASFYPLAEAAQRVGGDFVSVTNLTPPGVEPHDLELAPDDIETIATADVVLYLGGGFQPAVEDAKSQAEDAVVVNVLDSADARAAPPGEGDELQVDPHVWLDPARFERIVQAVEAVLAEADPANEADYGANADVYVAKVAALDEDFVTGLSRCERKTIVTSHEAFGYLADAYGLTQVGILGLSPEAEPDPRRLAELKDLVQREGVTTIFAEELVSPKVAETLANETGVEVAVLNPIESLTDEEAQAGEDYVSVMRENLATLRKALDCA